MAEGSAPIATAVAAMSDEQLDEASTFAARGPPAWQRHPD